MADNNNNMFPATLRKRPITMATTTTLMLLMMTLSSLSLPSFPSTFAFVAVVHPHFPRTATTVTTSSRRSSSSLMMQPQQRPTHYNTNDNLENEPMASTASSSTATTTALTKSTQPTPVVWSAFLHHHHHRPNNNNNWTSLAAALTIVLSSLSFLSSPADAAMSGGRMGGSFSSSRPSSFRGGGGGGGSRRMNMSPGRYNGGGGGYNYYGGGGPRTTIVAPIISPFAATTPFYNPIVPYYGGGVGAISYARGPGLFDLLFLGGIGFFVLSTISNTLSSQSSSSFGQWDEDGNSNNMFGLSSSATTTTVVKCNVALDVSNRDDPRSILSVLDRMAKVTAKTDTRQGVLTLTQQVAMELLRRKSSIYSAAGTIQQYKNNDKEAQRTYNQWSVQERSKFEQENVNKFNQFDLSLVKPKDESNPSVSVSSSKATMAVVTLVLSFDGSMNGNNNKLQQMKRIQSLSDLETVLQAVASMNQDASSLYGAEILWTPEDRSETLTRKDILADYPELNVL